MHEQITFMDDKEKHIWSQPEEICAENSFVGLATKNSFVGLATKNSFVGLATKTVLWV